MSSKNILKPIIICIILAILIEVFIFNIASYRLLFGKYEKRSYNNFIKEYDDNIISYYSIDNINTKVGTIKLDLNGLDEENKYCNCIIKYIDDTNKSGEYSEYLGEKIVHQDVENSKYISTYFSGDLKKLIIGVESYNPEYIINNITVVLNEKIPFEFNYIRFLIITIVLLFIYAFNKSSIFNERYTMKNYKQNVILSIVLCMFMFGALFINFNATEEEDSDNFLLGKITTEEGIYNKDFINALKSGQVHLNGKVSSRFANIKDPYNRCERDNIAIKGEDYVWDTAYFNGKTYIYFGILPAIIVFLPFNLLTHMYLKVSFFVFICTVAILFILKKILSKIISIFYKNIKFRTIFSLLIILYSGTMLLFINNCARVYEVSIMSALYLVLQGIYFLLKAYEKQNNNRYILLGCICMALSVACRPIALLSSLIIVPYLLMVFINYVKSFNIEENGKRNLILFILSVTVPYILVGISLMIYNNIRFGNPFEFGLKYQLTVCNANELKNRFSTIFIGLFTNFLMPPCFINVLPFIQKISNHPSFYGYYYLEDMIGGLFAICPLCLITFYIIKFNKKDYDKKIKVIVNSLLIVGLVMAVLSIMIAGSCQRYLIDYAWIFIFASIFMICSYLENCNNKGVEKIIEKLITLIMIYTLILSIFMGITGEKNYLENNNFEKYISLKENICFWE